MTAHAETFLSDCEQIEALITSGESIQNAQRIVFKARHEQIPKNGLGSDFSLPLTRQDALGITQVYSAQRRAYSHEELQQVNQLLAQNRTLKDSLVIYHSFLANFAKEYLSQHPERIGQTHEHFESIFLTQDFDENGLQVNPNLRFLSTFSGNILGGIVRTRNERGQNSPLDALNPEDITSGIKLAKSLGVFKMYVPKLNADSQSRHISWSSNLQQVCPADKMISQSASVIVPQIYEALTQKKGDININD